MNPDPLTLRDRLPIAGEHVLYPSCRQRSPTSRAQPAPVTRRPRSRSAVAVSARGARDRAAVSSRSASPTARATSTTSRSSGTPAGGARRGHTVPARSPRRPPKPEPVRVPGTRCGGDGSAGAAAAERRSHDLHRPQHRRGDSESLRLVGVRDWRCYALAFCSLATLQSVVMGTFTPLLLVGAALAWRYRDRRYVAASALAALIVVKLFLAPLVVWLWVTGRRAAAVPAVAIAAATTAIAWAVIGFHGFTSYPHLLSAVSQIEQHKGFSLTALDRRSRHRHRRRAIGSRSRLRPRCVCAPGDLVRAPPTATARRSPQRSSPGWRSPRSCG